MIFALFMDLKQKIDADFKETFRAIDQVALSTLRMLNAAIKNREVEKRTKLSKTEQDIKKLEELSKLTEDEIIQVVSSEIKRRREAAEQYMQGGRVELAQKEEKEAKILAGYLPEQLSEEEIRKLVKEAIQKSNAQGVKDTGKVMGILMPQVKGKADGNFVGKIVKEELGDKPET